MMTEETDGSRVDCIVERLRAENERLRALLREAYGYTTDAKDLLPERIKAALTPNAIQAACKARTWTLIAPDGRVWQDENPMLISAALLAELGRHMQPLGVDFAWILDENRWELYDDTEATTNVAIEPLR